jgi:exosortase/archaeosortase family protein
MDMYKASKVWFAAVMLCLISSLILFQIGMSYFPFVWAAVGVIVIYKARNEKNLGLSLPLKALSTLMGISACALALSMPSFRMPELSILISGLSIILFSLLEFRPLLVPSAIPIAVSIASRTIRYELTSIVAPLVDLTFNMVSAILHLFIDVHNNGHTLVFPNGMQIGIDTSCSGMWSLGAFIIAMFLVLIVFPYTFRKWLVFFSLGLVGTYALNIVRVTSVCLVGYYTGSDKYLELAHTHIGWILFTIWMIVFWYFFISMLLREQKKNAADKER